MKKYIKPSIDMLLLTSQDSMLTGSQNVTVDLSSDPVDAGNIESRHNHDVWGEEDEEDF